MVEVVFLQVSLHSAPGGELEKVVWESSSTLPLAGFVLGSPEFSSSACALEIAKWSASHHLRFLKSLCSIALFDFTILLLLLPTELHGTPCLGRVD